MKNLSSREKGNKLEKWLVAYLQEIDPTAKQSNNSGAVNNDGDLLNKYFVVEAKYRDTKSVTLKYDTWFKLSTQIPIGSQKIPLFVGRNKFKDTFAVLNFKDFLNLLRSAYGKTEE